MEKEIKVIVQLKTHFLSVNSLYKSRVGYKNGKPFSTIYKNPKATEIEREIREQLRSVDFSDYIEWLKTTPGFKLHVQFVFKKNITNSDTSNYLKNIEDIWTRFVNEDLGIERYDDRLHIEVSAVKSIIPKSKHEYACIYLTKSEFNVRLDQEEKPEKILLITEDEWKDEAVSNLVKNKVEYKIYDNNDIDKPDDDIYNTKLYIIDSKLKNSYITAEIINSVWKCLINGRGFIWIGLIKSTETCDSSSKFFNLIKSISNNSRIKIKYIKTVEDIFI